MADGCHRVDCCHHIPAVVLCSKGQEGEGRVKQSDNEERDQEEDAIDLVEDSLMQVKLIRWKNYHNHGLSYYQSINNTACSLSLILSPGHGSLSTSSNNHVIHSTEGVQLSFILRWSLRTRLIFHTEWVSSTPCHSPYCMAMHTGVRPSVVLL